MLSTTLLHKEFKLTSLHDHSRASVCLVDGQSALVVKVQHAFLPDKDFKEVFELVGNAVKMYRPKKLIFDMRALKVFEQRSIEWLFLTWKANMFKFGLSVHRQIAPENVFCQNSLKLGRMVIERSHPQGAYCQMDIADAASMEEAVQS